MGVMLLIALAANLDNLGVGLAFGVTGIRVRSLPNLIIACMAAGGTYASALLGRVAGGALAGPVPNLLGALVIIGVGVWVMLPRQPVGPRSGAHGWDVVKDPRLSDLDGSGDLSCRESVPLGVALGWNAVAGGLGAGLMGLSAAPVALLTGLVSFLTLAVGAWVGAGGRHALPSVARAAPLVAGILLILVGIHEIL